jgi:hypothetical protein
MMPNPEDFSIKITHLPTGQKVNFIGWVTAFSDSFSSTWNEVSVYGRMDALPTFQNTTRKLSVGFDVVAKNAEEAYVNDHKMNRLIQFLYPVYDRGDSDQSPDASIVAAAPLLRVSYANLVQSQVDQQGLVAYLDGVDYNPNIEAGQFFAKEGRGPKPFGKSTVEGSNYLENKEAHNQMFYQQLSVSLNFTILHSHLTGWVKGKGNTFYFGADPETKGGSKYLHNFPHGGTNEFFDGGLDPVPPATPPSEVAADPTDPGADAPVQTAKVEKITQGSRFPSGNGGGGQGFA